MVHQQQRFLCQIANKLRVIFLYVAKIKKLKSGVVARKRLLMVASQVAMVVEILNVHKIYPPKGLSVYFTSIRCVISLDGLSFFTISSSKKLVPYLKGILRVRVYTPVVRGHPLLLLFPLTKILIE